MGLSADVVTAIIREGAFKPYKGTAFTLGRQTVNLSPAEMKLACLALGLKPAIDDAGLDRTTLQTSRDGQERIADVDFLRMLGLETVKAVDVSNYEGAEIIHDLNYPIPADLEQSCDLLIDGSTLDNIFDPVTGLKNIGRMLKPGGRCFLVNCGNASPHFAGIPYTMFNPLWFFDYFVWNNFSYCQVYCLVFHETSKSFYALSLEHTMRGQGFGSGIINPINSEYIIAVFVFAEKGLESTWDLMPIQHAYRSEEDWAVFSKRVRGYWEAKRPLLLTGTNPDQAAPKVPEGWYRVMADGSLVNPHACLLNHPLIKKPKSSARNFWAKWLTMSKR